MRDLTEHEAVNKKVWSYVRPAVSFSRPSDAKAVSPFPPDFPLDDVSALAAFCVARRQSRRTNSKPRRAVKSNISRSYKRYVEWKYRVES